MTEAVCELGNAFRSSFTSNYVPDLLRFIYIILKCPADNKHVMEN